MFKQFCALLGAISVVFMIGNTLAKPVNSAKLAVWYAPQLHLSNRNEIQFRLNQPFDEGEELIVKKNQAGKTTQITIPNCIKMLEALEMDFESWLSPLDQQNYLVKKNYCESLQLLQAARPAKKSFLNNFQLQKSSLRFLPALIVPSTNGIILCGLVEKNYRGISLAKSERIEIVEESPDNRILIWTPSTIITLDMLGKGDFNGDGLADILLKVQSQNRDNQLSAFGNYIITRAGNNNVFSVINPWQYLLENSNCLF